MRIGVAYRGQAILETRYLDVGPGVRSRGVYTRRGTFPAYEGAGGRERAAESRAAFAARGRRAGTGALRRGDAKFYSGAPIRRRTGARGGRFAAGSRRNRSIRGCRARNAVRSDGARVAGANRFAPSERERGAWRR